MSSATAFWRQPYAARVANFSANKAAQQLLQAMEAKKSNLCVSVDVTTAEELLAVVDAVGADAVMIKTHIDILSDFVYADFVPRLEALLEKHAPLLIFEDRKFADIGNTVSLQYSSGVHRIAEWSHFTNAHLVPGPGIITGLAKEGVRRGRALLLLAEMSSKGNLCDERYRNACVAAAIQPPAFPEQEAQGVAQEAVDGFVVGFIAMNRCDEAYYARQQSTAEKQRDFLILTPGVNLSASGDAMGQQYRTPKQVVQEAGCDVIIVGRGIYAPLQKAFAATGADAQEQRAKAIAAVESEAKRYKDEGWKAYEARVQQQAASTKTSAGPSKRRKLFEPGAAPSEPSAKQEEPAAGSSQPAVTIGRITRARTSIPPATPPTRRASTRAKPEEDDAAGPSNASTPRRATRSNTVVPDAILTVDVEAGETVEDAMIAEQEGEPSKSGGKKRAASGGKAGKQASFFEVSPRKKQKTIKLELEAHEVKAAPKRWKEAYDVLVKQRKRIVAPVDTMGCEANGTDAHRADAWREEDAESKAKRERFTTLISLMLSSQTKDPVTAEAVKNLQTRLPNGLCLQSFLMASEEEISSCINKVGFWRRKTGYCRSAAKLIAEDFGGDVPADIHELCSIPGVGPKMAFLMMQSMGHNVGIGVDVHVHRMSNRLGWCKTEEPEETRLRLQSFLPKAVHSTINKALVGFGQVICVPISPRCDLCDLAREKLCPSRRKVDPQSVANRVQVHLLDEVDSDEERQKEEDGRLREVKEEGEPAVAVKLEVQGGPDGSGVLLANQEEAQGAAETQRAGASAGAGAAAAAAGSAGVKEEARIDW